MTNWQLIVIVASLVLAIFGANGIAVVVLSERITDLKAELRAEIGTMRAELKAETGTLRAETGTLRAEMHALNEKVDRIDKVFQSLYRPVLPGQGN